MFVGSLTICREGKNGRVFRIGGGMFPCEKEKKVLILSL